MKKIIGSLMLIGVFAISMGSWVRQEPATTTDTVAAPEAPAAEVAKTDVAAVPPIAEPEPVAAPLETEAPRVETPAAIETPSTENLEFVSGEITKVDEALMSITVKLYGEGDDKTTEKMLTVTVDANTDITDGEKDRDIKSLTASTEVDVEYDPASNKATYIFVY